MNFKKATDALFNRVTHEELAKELGVSVATIRQARLRPSAGAHRTPPQNWQDSITRIAEQRIDHYRKLLQVLRD